MMRVALFSHPDCLAHDTGPGHPECPERLRVVMRALEHPDFADLLRETAPEASLDQLALVHPARFVQALMAIHPEPGSLVALDGDTLVSTGSMRAALRAVGGAIAGVDAVMEGWAQAAFVATRPPGHHAEALRPMGFCFLNAVSVAAHHARARWGLRRVAVVDFDVHHGNGTQAILGEDPDMFYGSSHQMPCFPGTGEPSEHGIADNVVNVALPPGADGRAFLAAWDDTLLPALNAFAPELLLVSAGFDAHCADPLASLLVEEPDYTALTDRLLAVAKRHCQGRLVSVLEGGYDLSALASCTAAHVRRLLAG